MDERSRETEREREDRNTKESRKNEAGAGGAGESMLGLIGNSMVHPEVTGLLQSNFMSCTPYSVCFYESRSIDISLYSKSKKHNTQKKKTSHMSVAHQVTRYPPVLYCS